MTPELYNHKINRMYKANLECGSFETLDKEVVGTSVLRGRMTEDEPFDYDRLHEVCDNIERYAPVLSQINHPNIAKLYKLHRYQLGRIFAQEPVYVDDAIVYYEKVPGVLMNEFIEERGFNTLATEVQSDFLNQIFDSVDGFHSNGLIHRDIKISNYRVVTEERNGKINYRPVLMDHETCNKIGEEYGLKGVWSDRYAPLELFDEDGVADVRTDIALLATTLLETIWYDQAFTRFVIDLTTNGIDEDLKEAILKVDPKSESILKILQIARDPNIEKRYSSINEFRNAFMIAFQAMHTPEVAYA